MTCAHVQEEAAGLASLPDTDPDRQAAWAHAATCTACAEALARAVELQELLGALPPPPAPSTAALASASAPVHAALAREDRRRFELVAVCGVALAWGLEIALARHRIPGLAPWLQALGAALLAAVGAAGAVRFGGQAVGGAAVASAVFAVLVGSGGELGPTLGVHCFFAELVAAAITVAPATALLMARRRDKPFGFFAGLTAMGAFAGHAALNLTCPMRTALPHLLVFHTGGVLGAVVVAAAAQLAARRLSRVTA